jgi:hypothetical protein
MCVCVCVCVCVCRQSAPVLRPSSRLSWHQGGGYEVEEYYDKRKWKRVFACMDPLSLLADALGKHVQGD